jgi:hypothetical protein
MSRRSFTRLAAVAAVLITMLPLSSSATPAPWTYFTMTDGIKIAAAVRYPTGFNAQTDAPIPVLLQMDGYGAGGTQGINPASFGNAYITVYASVRGTGCSGGPFNLFDRRHAEDGYEIITNHLPNLPGANGDVGIIGHSYPGLTGWLVASTNPPNLKATAISGLIDDLYRGIVFPGGVPNYGFPAVWTGAYRPASETQGNVARYQGETASGDPQCAANIASRPSDAIGVVNSVLQNPILNGGTSIEDGDWWRSHSTLSWINGIKKPIHITQQYQDEQTGPRGGHVLFQRITGVPKRLVLTNGVHATTGVAHNDRVAWLDCYVRSVAAACNVAQDPNRVRMYFETTSNDAKPLGSADYATTDWPAPETQWTRYYLHADGTLSTSSVSGEGRRSYVSTSSGRQMTGDSGFDLGDNGLGRATFVDGPDQLRYELAVPASGPALSIGGPINLTLTASSTAVNTDFFVDVLDVAPDGTVQYLQRGMQRASHREINYHPSRTDYTPGGDIYRAWHPHTNTTTKLLTPATPEQFEIEIFPLGWVFRPGHKLVLQLHAPPPLDPLSIYAWLSALPPGVNTVLHDPVGSLQASSILLPVLPTTPTIAATAPACTSIMGVPCFKPGQ